MASMIWSSAHVAPWLDGGINLRVIELKENPALTSGLSPSTDSGFTKKV